MQASKELWEHVLLLVKTDKESFEGGLSVPFLMKYPGKWIG